MGLNINFPSSFYLLDCTECHHITHRTVQIKVTIYSFVFAYIKFLNMLVLFNFNN